jgi:hypothetical protein
MCRILGQPIRFQPPLDRVLDKAVAMNRAAVVDHDGVGLAGGRTQRVDPTMRVVAAKSSLVFERNNPAEAGLEDARNLWTRPYSSEGGAGTATEISSSGSETTAVPDDADRAAPVCSDS